MHRFLDKLAKNSFVFARSDFCPFVDAATISTDWITGFATNHTALHIWILFTFHCSSNLYECLWKHFETYRWRNPAVCGLFHFQESMREWIPAVYIFINIFYIWSRIKSVLAMHHYERDHPTSTSNTLMCTRGDALQHFYYY